MDARSCTSGGSSVISPFTSTPLAGVTAGRTATCGTLPGQTPPVVVVTDLGAAKCCDELHAVITVVETTIAIQGDTRRAPTIQVGVSTRVLVIDTIGYVPTTGPETPHCPLTTPELHSIG